MISNYESLEIPQFICKKPIAEYLIFKKGLSSLGVLKNNYFSFAKTEELKKALKSMPVHLKILSALTSHYIHLECNE